MKQIKKIFFFFYCWPQQDFIQYHKTTITQNKPTWFQYHKTTHTQNKSTGLWIRQHTLIPQFNTIRTNKHLPYKHMRLSFNSLIWYIPQITHLLILKNTQSTLTPTSTFSSSQHALDQHDSIWFSSFSNRQFHLVTHHITHSSWRINGCHSSSLHPALTQLNAWYIYFFLLFLTLNSSLKMASPSLNSNIISLIYMIFIPPIFKL